jgi:hypothetical protein
MKQLKIEETILSIEGLSFLDPLVSHYAETFILLPSGKKKAKTMAFCMATISSLACYI